MRAAKLRHRITIQQPTLTQDALGGQSSTFSDIDNRWGSINPLNAKEQLQQEKLEHKVTHKIRMRRPLGGANGAYFASRYFAQRYFEKFYFDSVVGVAGTTEITPDLRICFKDRHFEIRKIRNVDERNITLELECEEVFDK